MYDATALKLSMIAQIDVFEFIFVTSMLDYKREGTPTVSFSSTNSLNMNALVAGGSNFSVAFFIKLDYSFVCSVGVGIFAGKSSTRSELRETNEV